LAKAGSISFQPTYNAGTNRYSTLPGGTPAYDANGFLNVDGYHIYSYDAEGKNTLIDSSTVVMTYDALGRWVERAAGGGYTQAIYSPDGRKLALASGQSVATAYVALPGGAVVRYTGSGLDTYWHPDWLGTVRLYTSASRAVINDVAVAPFGERYVGNAADSFFTGVAQSAEAGDFTNFPARNYHFIEGRWLTPDPAGLAAMDPADPQTWNRYAYVDNDPLALVDPSGMFFGPPGSGGGTGGGGGGQVIQSVLQNCVANLQAAIGQDPGSSYHGDFDTAQQCARSQISAPSPNYGSGGGGGGGTAAKTGLTAAQLQALKNAAKLDAGVCANAFSSAMSSVGQRFSLKTFDSQIQNIRYNLYPDVATNPLGPLSSVEARELKNSINLYPNFFTDTPTRQAGIVVHENLHVYTGWNDSNVFYMFQTRGITPNDIRLFTSYGNTDGITTWILRGCR
jgi:RHS repeat-associated protein